MKTNIYNKVRAILLLLAPCSLLLFASCEDYLNTVSKSATDFSSKLNAPMSERLSNHISTTVRLARISRRTEPTA